jgi:hypothetical protein
MGNVVRRCSTFIRIKRGFGYTQEFRRCGFTENAPGVATRLTVAIKQPSTTHEVQWGKVETWIQSAGKPNEQVLKTRLRELLRS